MRALLLLLLVLCFFSHDELSGLNRICWYTCVGGDAAVTIPAGRLCPLTIRGGE